MFQPTSPHASHDSDAINAIEFMRVEHARTRVFFRILKSMADPDQLQDKSELAHHFCAELLHCMLLEEVVLYPALHGHVGADELIDEAQVEHDCLRELIQALLRRPANHPRFDAAINVLRHHFDHHLQEKEYRLFPRALSSSVDLAQLGRRLAAASYQLQRDDGSLGDKIGNHPSH